MKPRLCHPFLGTVLLLTVACTALADNPPAGSRSNERKTTGSPVEPNQRRPAISDPERMPGGHEYQSDDVDDLGLRRAPAASSTPAESHQKTDTATTGREKRIRSGSEEPMPEHTAQQGEGMLRSTQTTVVRNTTQPSKSGTKLIEGEHIQGHLAEQGDARLRLGGETEPDTGNLAKAGPDTETKNRPIFIAAENLRGHTEKEIEAIGRAELTSEDRFISADRMKYNQDTEEAEAEGGVRVERRGDVMEGSRLKFNLATKTGELSSPRYSLRDASSRGHASSVLFEGENQYRLRQATYTTCPAGEDDWLLQVDDMEIDNTQKVGTARKVKLTFKDTPILYTPWLDFSFSGQRKSGLLAPLYGYNVRTGVELTLPFYWNIAPNYDATISARAMSKRGVSLNSEFRYLGKTGDATLLADILPRDFQTGETRYRVSFGQNQTLGKGFYSRLDYNRVSDDFYFRDLGNTLNLTSRVNLLQQALLGYNRNLGENGTLNVIALGQQFQTIQDPLAQVVAPYKRLPQIMATINKSDILGADLNLISSWTNFSHPTLINGHRITFFPSVSYPMRNAFGYITPKVGVHHTRYYLDSGGVSSDPTRTLPIFSLDSSVMFERQMQLGGERFTQTLEPRLFYVYVPYRNQDGLPNFDSGKTDFSFAQMLTENRFSGSDRINDANQVSFALTSRFIEPGSGKERFRVAVGQQLSFINRRITLDTPSTVNRRPDFIGAVTGFITPTISTDSSVQFDQKNFTAEVVRSGLSYRPEPGRVLNFGYRFTKDVLHQVDASSQWRWSERWQTVARLNYSLQDARILEGLAGLEYNACCWSLRFVVQHLTLATQKTTTAAFVQLELNGLMQIGSNPLQVLQRSIPGYTRIGSQGSGTVEGPQ
jgi:LPS-assembly protein